MINDHKCWLIKYTVYYLFFKRDCVLKLFRQCHDVSDEDNVIDSAFLSYILKALRYNFSKSRGENLFADDGCSYVVAKQSQVLKYLTGSDVHTNDNYEILRTNQFENRSSAMKNSIKKPNHMDDYPEHVWVALINSKFPLILCASKYRAVYKPEIGCVSSGTYCSYTGTVVEVYSLICPAIFWAQGLSLERHGCS